MTYVSIGRVVFIVAAVAFTTGAVGVSSWSRKRQHAGGDSNCASSRNKPRDGAVYSFLGHADGALPYSAITADVSGVLYGTTFEGGADGKGTVFALTPRNLGLHRERAPQLSWISGWPNPTAGIYVDASGSLYGTTTAGGLSNGGYGTVFKLTPSGASYKETVIYSRFRAGTDGWNPEVSLIADSGGALYGTTKWGGYTCLISDTCGTVFKLTPSAKGYDEKVLFVFGGPSGEFPQSGLLADDSGALYGTVSQGGAGYSVCLYGCGVVFKLTPSSSGYTFSALYSFLGGTDGEYPYLGTLIAGKAGKLYGTTYYGGTGKCFVSGATGCGTVFRLTPSGSTYSKTILYSFKGGNDGALPIAGLLADRTGALYGTTVAGGGTKCRGGVRGCGTIFKLTPQGKGYAESVVHAFQGKTDGELPYSSLASDPTGAFYGTSERGGTQNEGTVFKLTPSR